MRNYNSNPQCGIYRIRCMDNLCIYFGSTTDFVGRKKEHIEELNRNVHCNSKLQSAWNKYGKYSFVFDFIENVDKEKLLQVEQIYLDCLFTEHRSCRFNLNPNALKPPGVRMIGSANPMFGKKLSTEHRKKLSVANSKPKPYMTEVATKSNKNRIVGKGYRKYWNKYKVRVKGFNFTYSTESEAIEKVKELRGL